MAINIHNLRVYNMTVGAGSSGGEGGGGGGYSIPIETSGLQVWWDAGDTNSYSGTGTTMTDLSGNGNDGVIGGSPTYNSAGASSYFNFVNTTTFQSILDDNSSQVYGITADDGFTLSMWAKMPNQTSNINVGSLGDGSFGSKATNFSKMRSNLPSATYRNVLLFQAIGAAEQGNASLNPLWVNNGSTWTNLTLVVLAGSSTGDFKSFVNGTLLKTRTGSFPLEANHFTSLMIGNYFYHTGGGNPLTEAFRGDWANVALYNRELSNAEVVSNFDAIKSRYGY
jgi:hypothetical protein